jgi:hypothetical protein
MRAESQGYWCDVCGQLHYQTPPQCHRRRAQREAREFGLWKAAGGALTPEGETPDQPPQREDDEP